MKIFICFLILCAAPATYACTAPTKSKLGSILYNGKVPTYWRTVQGTSYVGNRSYPAFVTVQRRLERSFVEYKGDVYRFDEQGITICDRKRSNEIRVVHPKAKATIVRTGNGKEAMLTIRSGIFTFRARPTEVVSEPSNFTEELDFFQSIFTPEY